MECNLCGSTTFKDFRGRKDVLCSNCHSIERTRVLKLILDHHKLLWEGARVLHFAPELGVSRYIRTVVGDTYEPKDFNPERYREINPAKFDLTVDAQNLPENRYDLVLHSHVLEHLICDVTAVLYYLHRSLKGTGKHVFCVPIMHGNYECDLGPRSASERLQRFGLDDHVRRYGRADIDKTLGMVFNLGSPDLTKLVSEDVLKKYNIPEGAWRGHTAHTFYVLSKDDIKLRGCG